MPRVVHFEIVADMPERVMKFYKEVFAWEFKKWDGPQDYWFVKTAFSAVELLLTRVEKGLDISEEMLMMISSLASSAGILCDNCEKQLADKFAINDGIG